MEPGHIWAKLVCLVNNVHEAPLINLIRPYRKSNYMKQNLANNLTIVMGIIGIFGFLTGIFSVPQIISRLQGKNVGRFEVWFSANIPTTVSISVLILTILFVLGIYFYILIGISIRLSYMGVLSSKPASLYDLQFGAGEIFVTAFYVIFGFALTMTIVGLFFASLSTFLRLV